MTTINPILKANGCPEDDALYIRRIVTATGRNRVFINGSRSTLSLLQQVTSGLIDVIGQHASHRLLDSSAHIDMLDTFAHTHKDAAKVSTMVTDWRRLKKEASQLRALEDQRQARMATLQDQLDEIQLAELSEDEEARIENELEQIFNSEEIKDRTLLSIQLLREQDGSVLELLSSVSDSIRRVSHAVPELDSLLDPLSEITIQLGEMCHDLRPFSEGGDVSQEDIELLQSRLETIQSLKKRHGGSVQHVLSAAHSMSDELDRLHGDNIRIKTIEETLKP